MTPLCPRFHSLLVLSRGYSGLHFRSLRSTQSSAMKSFFFLWPLSCLPAFSNDDFLCLMLFRIAPGFLLYMQVPTPAGAVIPECIIRFQQSLLFGWNSREISWVLAEMSGSSELCRTHSFQIRVSRVPFKEFSLFVLFWIVVIVILQVFLALQALSRT